MTSPRTDAAPEAPGPSTRTVVRLVTGAGAVLLLLAFVIQNDARVRVEFLMWDMTTRLAWALIVAAALGMLIGLAAPRLWRLARGHRRRERS